MPLQTSWVVITGAPSSGKTSVIHALQSRGHDIRDESARAVIEQKLESGESLEDVRGSQQAVARLQRRIFSLQRQIEDALDPAALVFLDRGLADSAAYYRLHGLDDAAVIQAAGVRRYACVFMFDRLPVVQDAVRNEDDAEANRIAALLREVYTELGYKIINVPVLSVEERADYVLARLNGLAASA